MNGGPLQWRDPGLSCLCLTLRCSAEAPVSESDNDVVFMVLNREEAAARVRLPRIEDEVVWQRCIDTAYPERNVSVIDDTQMTVNGSAVVALSLVHRTEAA